MSSHASFRITLRYSININCVILHNLLVRYAILESQFSPLFSCVRRTIYVVHQTYIVRTSIDVHCTLSYNVHGYIIHFQMSIIVICYILRIVIRCTHVICRDITTCPASSYVVHHHRHMSCTTLYHVAYIIIRRIYHISCIASSVTFFYRK